MSDFVNSQTQNRTYKKMRAKAQIEDQQSIFDQAERKKREGMEVSYQNSSSFWKSEAGDLLNLLAHRQETLTSEDVIVRLERNGVVTANNKAMGAVMSSGQRAGLIEPTGEWKTSSLKRRNKAPIRLWRSKVYKS